MVEYNINELCSIDAIFDFFNKSNYEIEDDRSAFPISELIEKSVEGDAWLIVNHTNLMVIAIRAEKFNQKTYRTKVNNYLKELAGMKLIFYTDEFDYYHLTLIYDGFFSINFKPSDPDMIIVRIFEALESGEDLFDFTKQDINFILLKRELTAKALKDSIKKGENSSVKIVFQDGGLKLIGKGSNKIITAHEDAPVRDLIIDVNLNSDIGQIEQAFIDTASELYENYCSRKLKLICMITKKGIIYHWIPYSISGFINYKNPMDADVMDDVLESLIAQVSYITAFNSETFHQQFGTHSPFFILGISAYEDFLEQELEKIRIMYEEWRSRFSKVYQTGDLDQELFIKHAYLALLVKTVLISKFVSKDEKEIDRLQRIIEIFEERGVPIFLNDFFQWTQEEKIVQNEIFAALHNAQFIIDDLFRTIYQEMVSPATRHALGEFYTPPQLAEKMVDEAYEFNQSILDPACGSGSFLVQILKSIDNSNNNREKKIEAISKIYGFDVNPIAVLVARSNFLLLTDKLFSDSAKIPINIYLADSLNPINEFSASKKEKFHSLDKWGTAHFGHVERFNMTAINDSLVINLKFFKYSEKFGILLKELDRYLSKNIDFSKLLNNIYNSIDDNWLDENCEGTEDESLRDNFEYIAEKLYKIIQKDHNHIWAYLLYNAIGVRKMKETMDGVDLLLGNPPWLTINSILSDDYKKFVKDISKELGIYVGGKQTPNTELCSIFFCKTADLYLKKNGRIFFVATAALESGGQHSKFRLFEGFKDIILWKFSSDVFKIPNITIGGIKGSNQPINERLKIKTKHFKVSQKKKRWEFEIQDELTYVPYNYNTINRDKEAKRLIPFSKLDEMLPHKDSPYKKRFKRGADLFPRNFFFIKLEKDDTVIPDKTLIQKKPWNFYPVEKYDFESEYLYDVCKSTELIPFHLTYIRKCFLPIERKDHSYHKDLIKPKAKKLFDKFKKKYTEIQKRDQRRITDLWDNLNHMNKLSNPLQFSPIKVVYPASGSFLKSAIIQGNVIVDTKLYYIDIEDINEAYYLCAIFNSKIVSNDIKHRSATGFQGKGAHIHKRALEYPIPFYNKKNNLHNNIVKIGKSLEGIVEEIIYDLKEQDYNYLKRRIMCKFCEKTYAIKNGERYIENHKKLCKKAPSNYTWKEDDWINLETISKVDIKLSFLKTQNTVLENKIYDKKLDELDKLVIQLFYPNGDKN